MYNKVSSIGIGMTGTVTRPANTDTYTAGDVIGSATTAIMTMTDVNIPAGMHYIILGASLRVDLNAIPASMGGFKLHLYSSIPTNSVDSDVFNLAAADRDKYLGYINFNTPEDLGDTLYIAEENLNMKRKLVVNTQTIYGILTTNGALVGASGTVFTVKLHLIGA